MSTVVCWFQRTLKQLEREQTDTQTHRHTHKTTTVTLAHARRGLITGLQFLWTHSKLPCRPSSSSSKVVRGSTEARACYFLSAWNRIRRWIRARRAIRLDSVRKVFEKASTFVVLYNVTRWIGLSSGMNRS